MDLFQMSAIEAVAAIRSGEITSEELVQDCLKRIEAIEDTVGAWTHLDAEYALTQARDAHSLRQSGAPLGPLHGIPVGIKDIFDTQDMPTEYGSVLHAGRRPNSDATAVALLRAAGAIIMGKTVTTELAVYAPGKTTNPHDATRTPGGSSSGSAAAVAASMVPVSIGTQTNGSIIRPASYCGIYGYKPSYGTISRYRVLQQSRLLDHVGVFGRSIEDIALIAEVLMAFDQNDPDMQVRARPALQQILAQEPPVPPRLAFVKTPMWEQADNDTHMAFAELVAHLGEHVEHVELPEIFNQAVTWHRTIMEADLAHNFERDYERGKDRLSLTLREMIERGQQVRAIDYNRAVERVAELNSMLNELFENYDAILTPATTGEAPIGLKSTGSPLFCTLWTLCGTPAISLPLMQGLNQLPMGAQLVAAKGDDARLLRTARWLVNFTAA